MINLRKSKLEFLFACMFFVGLVILSHLNNKLTQNSFSEHIEVNLLLFFVVSSTLFFILVSLRLILEKKLIPYLQSKGIENSKNKGILILVILLSLILLVLKSNT